MFGTPRPRVRGVRLRCDQLESREVPAFLTSAEVVVGSDAGAPPVVRITDAATQQIRSEFLAFDSTFSGGVRVAVGDVNGDGVSDLIVAAGPGGGPVVKTYNGQNGNLMATFFAFDSSFTGGVQLGTADIDGNGTAEVIVGAGVGGAPQVGIFNGATGAPQGAFYAYDSSLRGGVRVAGGDVDGDGKAEIVTGAGPGGGPDVRVYRYDGGIPRQTLSFFALDPEFRDGIYVASGNITGSSAAEIVVGAGSGGAPQVLVFTGNGTGLQSFFAYDPSFRGGVRVDIAPLSDNTPGQIITVPGPGGGPQVNVYTYPGTTPVASLMGQRSDYNTGYFVTGSPNTLPIPSSSPAQISDAYNQVRQIQQQEILALQQQLAAAQQQQQAQYVAVPYYYYGYPYYGYAPYPYYGTGWGWGSSLGFAALGLGLGGLGLGSYYSSYSVPSYATSSSFLSSPSFISTPSFGVSDFGFSDFGFSDFDF